MASFDPENVVGTFMVEDAFFLTSRGLVLLGVSQGPVITGHRIVYKDNVSWLIQGVERVLLDGRQQRTGLLIAHAVSSHREVVRYGIIGKTAHIIAQ